MFNVFISTIGAEHLPYKIPHWDQIFCRFVNSLHSLCAHPCLSPIDWSRREHFSGNQTIMHELVHSTSSDKHYNMVKNHFPYIVNKNFLNLPTIPSILLLLILNRQKPIAYYILWNPSHLYWIGNQNAFKAMYREHTLC